MKTAEFPSSKIHAFVAGALAVMALRGPFLLIHGLAVRDLVLILGGAFVFLALPLGLGMLFESAKTVWLAKLYLIVAAILQGGILVFAVFKMIPPEAPRIHEEDVVAFSCTLGLLTLLILAARREAQGK